MLPSTSGKSALNWPVALLAYDSFSAKAKRSRRRAPGSKHSGSKEIFSSAHTRWRRASPSTTKRSGTSVKSAFELPHYNAGIHLCQCGEHLRTSRRAKPLNAVERATVTTNMVYDLERNRSCVEPRELLRRTHLQVCKPLGYVHRHSRCGLPGQDLVPIRTASSPAIDLRPAAWRSAEAEG